MQNPACYIVILILISAGTCHSKIPVAKTSEYELVIPKDIAGETMRVMGYSLTGMKVDKIKEAVNRKFKPGDTRLQLTRASINIYLADVFRVKIRRLQKVEIVPDDVNEGIMLVLHYR